MMKLVTCAVLSLLATACLTTDPDDLGAVEDELAITADKTPITDDGLTKCDGGNEKCFDALKNDAKNCSNTTGEEQQKLKCWCTHCDNGNFCEAYADHQTHDDKCTLKPKTALEQLDCEVVRATTGEGDPASSPSDGA